MPSPRLPPPTSPRPHPVPVTNPGLTIETADHVSHDEAIRGVLARGRVNRPELRLPGAVSTNNGNLLEGQPTSGRGGAINVGLVSPFRLLLMVRNVRFYSTPRQNLGTPFNIAQAGLYVSYVRSRRPKYEEPARTT